MAFILYPIVRDRPSISIIIIQKKIFSFNQIICIVISHTDNDKSDSAMAQHIRQMVDLMSVNAREWKCCSAFTLFCFKIDITTFVYAVIVGSGRDLEVCFGYLGFVAGRIGDVDDRDRRRFLMNISDLVCQILVIGFVDLTFKRHPTPRSIMMCCITYRLTLYVRFFPIWIFHIYKL